MQDVQGVFFREFKITEKEEKKRKKYDRYKSNIKKKIPYFLYN